VKPIGDMAMTGATRQKKYRDKIRAQTLEEAEKEELKIKEKCCDMIYQLGGTIHIYTVHALLRSLTYRIPEAEEEKEKIVMGLVNYANAQMDYEIELIERDGELWEESE